MQAPTYASLAAADATQATTTRMTLGQTWLLFAVMLAGVRVTQAAHLVTSLPAIFVIGWIASRLLGTRHSWLKILLAGMSGWLAAVALALVISNNDVEAPEFTRNVWVFSVIITMLGLVCLELIGTPGALARAQFSLISPPRPLRALRRRVLRLSRYAQLTRIAAKHGIGPYLGLGRHQHEEEEESDGRSPLAHRVAHALEEAGGMFVKLGQVLSTRRDLLPLSIVKELSHLQDRVAPASQEAIKALLVEELGAPVGDVFAEFDWRPVAAASIAQAHRAKLRTGEQVIVKVQRPGIGEAVARDIEVLLQLARTMEARASWASEYQVKELAEDFAQRLREELDFTVEARNAQEIAGNLATMRQLHVPEVYQEFSSGRILVMEWLDGVGVRQAAEIAALGFDRRSLADVLMRSFMQQMVEDGCFHADPHPGNVLVLRDGRLSLIDFGAVSRLDAMQQASMREMLVAINQRDAVLLRQALMGVASVRRRVDDLQLERALARFMARRLGPGSAPSAAMFNEMLMVLFTFGISLPGEFGSFFRALVALEGTLTTLSPGYLIIQAAQDQAAEWARERVTTSSLREAAQHELASMLPMLRRMPAHFDRIATIVERGDLAMRTSLLSEPQDVRVLTTLVNRLVLGLLGGFVGLLAILLLSVSTGPAFMPGTSLLQFFGYVGLFWSAVLILRVTLAVLHSDLD